MPSEAAIMAICAAIEAVCSVVKLAIERQPPEVRAQLWKWYVEDAERWRASGGSRTSRSEALSGHRAVLRERPRRPRLAPHPAASRIAKLTDRVVFAPSDELADRLDWLTVTGRWERWDFVANHGVTAKSGWREQVVLHDHAVEVDIDFRNPNHGAAPALLHLIEIWTPGKTDPFRVARGLRRRGIEVPYLEENEHA